MTSRLSRCLAAGLALLGIFALQPRPLAQSEADRLYAEMTRYPALGAAVWPADFNSDGISDLAGARLGSVVVSLGRGDGTFGPEFVVASGVQTLVGAGDLNGDGAADILALRIVGQQQVSWVVPGHGDGTFSNAVPLAIPFGAPTLVADINHDGQPDLVTTATADVRYYPGRGGLTFGPATVLRFPDGVVRNPILADIEGDGFLDVLAVSSTALHAFRYIGGDSFQRASISLQEPGLAIAVGDLNRDGVNDVVVSTGRPAPGGAPGREFSSGSIRVLIGDGGFFSFSTEANYSTKDGPVSVVIGDFDGDTIPDVATGNSSPHIVCLDDFDGWDTVSLFRGRGDGAMASPTTLALDDMMLRPGFPTYQGRLERLHLADLDRDGRADLVASPAVVLLSRPAPVNSPPVANAGPDRIQADWRDEPVSLKGAATDADNDVLTFEWTDEVGRFVGDRPWQCIDASYIGTHTFMLTVRDGHGGVSTDSMTLTLSYGDDPLPSGWGVGDVGDTGAAGFTVYADWAGPISVAPFTVTGAGADIWGTSDAFHFAQMLRDGDFDISALVLDVQDVHEWTKAGLMIRESLSPDARHASVFVTPGTHGVVFQRRPVSGASSVHTQGPATAAPVWIRLRRSGDAITAFSRPSENAPWAEIGSQTLDGLGASVYVGLAITSHVQGRLASAYISHVTLSQGAPPLPAGWIDADVGNTAVSGSGSFAAGQAVLQGSGADIWSTSDAFHFTYLPVAGDFVARVTVQDIIGPHPWSKAGLMLRQSLDPSSPHHFLLMSESNGLAYQRRLSAGDISAHTSIAGSGPAGFLIRRSGDLVTLEYSPTPNVPASWQVVGRDVFPAGPALLGLAVTSHHNGELATATFDQPQILNTPAVVWTGQDIGAVGIAGSHFQNEFAGTVDLTASGVDIWSTTDSFRFVYASVPANASIVARLQRVNGPDPWTKAGVMVRVSTSPSSPHAFLLVSQNNGVAFQRRTVAGGITTHTAGPGIAPWLRLTRIGDLIIAATSQDGLTWTELDSDVLPTEGNPVLVGIALTSHNNGATALASFTDVRVTGD